MSLVIKKLFFLYFSDNPYKNGLLFFFLNLLLALGIFMAMTGYFAIIFIFVGSEGRWIGFFLNKLGAIVILSVYFLACLKIWFRSGEVLSDKHSTKEVMIISSLAILPFAVLFSSLDINIFPYLLSIWVVLFGLTGLFASVSKEMYYVSMAMLVLIVFFGVLSISLTAIDTGKPATEYSDHIFSLVSQHNSYGVAVTPFVLDLKPLSSIVTGISALRLILSYGILFFITSMMTLGLKRLFFKKSPFTITEELITTMGELDREKSH